MKTKRIIIDIPMDEFEKLKIITTKQEYWISPTELVEKVVKRFIRVMEEKIYPRLEEIQHELSKDT